MSQFSKAWKDISTEFEAMIHGNSTDALASDYSSKK
jgi:hypothetical protein